MWISGGRRGLLALAAAVAVETVNGDFVTFTDGFTVNGRNTAVLPFALINNRPFSWSSDNIVVEEIKLFSFTHMNGVVVPNTETEVGSAKRPESDGGLSGPWGEGGTPGGSRGVELRSAYHLFSLSSEPFPVANMTAQ